MGHAVDLDACYSVNRPLVVSDTIEDETVILHHGSGRYFDTAGTGAFIWRQIEAGSPPRSIAQAIEAGAGIPTGIALEAVVAFTSLLLANDLISPARSDECRRESGPIVGPAEFSQPVLGVHTDLADMLLLDPIHEVGPTGWPRRPDVAPPTASFDAP
jgi:hypothetical protein